MRLHSIPDGGGAHRDRKRVGRGEGAGTGKTCGRGPKGQKSRSGYSQRPGFESGHIPLYRRLPKRGFNNKNYRITYAVVNLDDLARLAGDIAEPQTLAKAGLIRSQTERVKILGNGELSRAMTVRAHRFSAAAAAKIEKAGGTAVVLETKGPVHSESAAEPEGATI